MRFDTALLVDTAPTLWLADVNLFLVIYSADTHDNFVLIKPPHVH